MTNIVKPGEASKQMSRVRKWNSGAGQCLPGDNRWLASASYTTLHSTTRIAEVSDYNHLLSYTHKTSPEGPYTVPERHHAPYK